MKGIILILTFLDLTTRSCLKADASIPSNSSLNTNGAKRNLTVLESWERLEKTVKSAANAGFKMILPVLMDNSAKLNLSRECVKDSMHLLLGLKNLKTWAVQFIDSSGKMIDGMMNGALSAFGSYEECLSAEVRSTRMQDKGKILYRGQYCTIDLKPVVLPKKSYRAFEIIKELQNFTQRDTVLAEAAKYTFLFSFYSLRLGMCLPSGCSVEDINKIAYLVGDSVTMDIEVSRCEVKEEKTYSPTIIAILTCYSFAVFMMLVGTLIDLYGYYRKIAFKNTFIQVLMAFSLFTNFRKFSCAEPTIPSLSFINGMRFIGMSWVICGHTYLTPNFRMLTGLFKAPDIVGDFAFQPIINATVVVDTFYCMAGFLLCYLTMKIFRDEGYKLNVGVFIFHRLFRIYPVYIFAIMFMMMAPLLGSGPQWEESIGKYIQDCYDNWWTNLIFINNFYDANHMCILQSWYLATDFQLYIAALFIVIPMLKWPKVGIITSCLSIIASVVYAGVTTYVEDLPPTALIYTLEEEMRKFMVKIYVKPFLHVSPYCIGILAGYLYSVKPNMKIPPLIQLVGWSLAFISNFSVLYGAVEWNRGVHPTFLETMVYSSLNRTVWTLGVAWIIICCATGHGGVINSILSWKVFIPLGRLTYVAYLIHPIVQLIFVGNASTVIQADHIVAVWIFFGHMCVTYILAFGGSMLIEAPFLSLERMLIKREKKSENNTTLKENIILNGSFKPMNGDVSAIGTKSDEEFGGMENGGFRNKL